MVMACKIKLYYSESDLKYVSLGIKNYRGLIRIVDLLHFKLIFFEDINMSKPILVPESDLMVIIQKFPYQINTFLSFSFTFFGVFVHVDIW